jgi:hypothetical protein
MRIIVDTNNALTDVDLVDLLGRLNGCAVEVTLHDGRDAGRAAGDTAGVLYVDDSGVTLTDGQANEVERWAFSDVAQLQIEVG